ncbi:hypothetical protein SAMN04490248_104224 [Salinihabitans flavidus]|uniref:HTH-like domain-containing protein n=1 Tax=Salinihabitans flavidus TaxID=569882 RepID=A0A1H8PCH7_9RHOB|nr:hypothetical protein SAMN04490248_104224 [Salinihabitans flavidus]
MIDPTAKLSVSRQAGVLGISRGSVYYKPRPVSDADLKLMHRLDKLHMEFPFAGNRMLRGLLVQEGFKVGRLHVATLMKRMGIEALYRKPNTSKPAPGHKIYPYLLRKLPITPAQPGLGDGGLTPASPRPVPRSAVISASKIAGGLIRRLTGKRPIRPTSTSRCPKRQRPSRGGKPLTKRPEPVQTNRTTSQLVRGWKLGQPDFRFHGR